MNPIPLHGPWLLSAVADSSATGSILLSKDVKRYTKFVVTIDSELSNLNVLNFLLLVEVAISEPNSPVLTTATKNILKRFPSWMSMYKDTLDQSTPNLYVPESTSAKVINSIIGENLDLFSREIDSFRLNSYINTADENQLSWIYSSKNVINTFNKIIGNNIELARVDNLVDFYKSKNTDYIFYHDPVNREILTLKNFTSLFAKSENTTSIELVQLPILKFNWFDEFGAMVGLQRLYLESNTSFKVRILDVFQNPNGADIDSFKKVLRRELNLWKAFGATPSSNHLGATPEILEISDIEYSTPYFTADGNPTDKFMGLVEDFNVKYPNNWGYFKFDDALWDYAGIGAQGVGRIKSRYYDDYLNVPYYQPGVGDLSDAKLVISNRDATPKYFSTSIVATGKKKTGTTLSYSPVLMGYQYYGSYEITEYDNPAATVNLTLEFDATPHGGYATPTTFFTSLILYPKNNFGPSSSASPEYNSLEIFDTEGYVSSRHTVLEKNTLKGYKDSTKTTNPTRLNVTKLLNLKVKNGQWNGTTYATPNSNNFTAKFSHRNSTLVSSSSLLSATPNFTQNTQLQYMSSLYTAKQVTKNTATQTSSIRVNDVATPPVDYQIDHSRIVNNIIFPAGATPKYIYVENIKPSGTYGGLSYYSEIDEDVFIPSSPNIVLNYYGSNLSTPISNSKIGNTQVNSSHATANYYFTKIQYPYSGTPNSLTVSTVNTSLYPFKAITWEPFTLTSSTPISGYVDEEGIVNYNAAQGEYTPGHNSDQILVPELTRRSFGLTGSTQFEYFFENINIVDPPSLDVFIWSEQKVVKPFLNRTYVLNTENIPSLLNNAQYTELSIDYPNNSIVESFNQTKNTTVFTNFTTKGRLYDSKLDATIKTGWINIGKHEHYIYAKPVKETFSGKLKTITLSGMPRQGAPILLESASPFTEVAFADEATPREFGFYNTEILKPKFDNSFHLGYKNTYDLSITDGLTGELLFTQLSATPSYISIPTSQHSFVRDRDYSIRYRVKNSYHIDNVLSGSNYYSVITFDSTPSSTMNYSVTYESSIYERSTPVSLNFGQTSSVLEEGYIIMSDIDYAFSTAKVVVSPSYIFDDRKDYLTLSIISVDINGNPKPHQSFSLSSPVLTFASTLLTTNSEGFATTSAVYNSATRITSPLKSTISISGVNHSSNTLAHISSQSSGYSRIEPVNVYSNNKFNSQLIVTANPDRINADGVSSIYVNGILTTGGVPQSNKIVYWKKARDLYSALKTVSYSTSTTTPGSAIVSGIAVTDSNGKFSIGPVVSQSRLTPGYWFIVVESELSTSATSTPTAVVGDAAYWYEAYDNIDYNYASSVVMPDLINYDTEKSLMLYATPSFKVSYYRDDLVVSTHATPRWQPPVWLPLSRYEQYQAGFLGSTPYSVYDYSGLIKDYED